MRPPAAGTEGLTRAEAERVAGAAVRNCLGNRCRVASVGGAPVSEAVFEFVKRVLGVDIANTYGTRECGGITMDGVVYPGIDVRLLDVPEMGYFTTDVPSRGEVCVRSPRQIPGYFDDATESARNFVALEPLQGGGGGGSDGGGAKLYFRTGDVAEMWADEEGRTRLKIVDRRSFVLKLPQGEFVAPSRVEAVLEDSPLVRQALVVGRPTARAVVAVVVPCFASCAAAGLPVPASLSSTSDCEEVKKGGGGDDNDDGGGDRDDGNEGVEGEFRRKLARELTFWCRHHHLRTFEVPARFVVECGDGGGGGSSAEESGRWTAENGLLTSNLKKDRRALHAHYRAATDPLLDALASLGSGGAQPPLAGAAGATALHPPPLLPPQQQADPRPRVSAALADLLERSLPLGSCAAALSPETTLAELGADSLVAGRLSGLLLGCGVALSMPQLFNYSLAHLGDLLSRADAGTLGAVLGSSSSSSSSSSIGSGDHAVDFGREHRVRCGRVSDLAPWARAAATSAPLEHATSVASEAAEAPGMAAAGTTSTAGGASSGCCGEGDARRGVFVTGATGFLGPVLVGALLRRFPRHVVYCLVRGRSDAEAGARLRTELYAAHRHAADGGSGDGGDGEGGGHDGGSERKSGGDDDGGDDAAMAAAAAADLATLDAAFAEDRVVSVRGDLTIPGFGIFDFGGDDAPDPTPTPAAPGATAAAASAAPGGGNGGASAVDATLAARLLATVEVIVHSGSRVNHALPYGALRAANVGGTRAAIALALRCALKPRLHFVSSVAALPVGKASDDEGPASATVAPLSSGQMAQRDGYGQTKAVGERLMCDAAARFGLLASVHRPSVVCGSTRTGYSNVHDLENHLIRAAVLVRGIVAPSSYGFGWVPVDVVAEAVAAIAQQQRRADVVAAAGGGGGSGGGNGSGGVDECEVGGNGESGGSGPGGGNGGDVSVFHLNGVGPNMDEVVAALKGLGYGIAALKQRDWASALRALPTSDGGSAGVGRSGDGGGDGGQGVPSGYRDILERIAFPAAGLVGVSHAHGRASRAIAAAIAAAATTADEAGAGAELPEEGSDGGRLAAACVVGWPCVSAGTIRRCLRDLQRRGSGTGGGAGFLPMPEPM